MTQTQQLTLINGALLLEKAGGNKRLLGKIFSAVQKWQFVPSGTKVSGEDRLTEENMLALYNNVVIGGTNWRGIGENSARAMSNYLLEKGLIDVDYRFGHMPRVDTLQDLRNSDRHPEVFERAEVKELARPPKNLVYVVGVNVDESGTPLLVYGTESGTLGDVDIAIRRSLSAFSIDGIESYNPLIPQKPRFKM